MGSVPPPDSSENEEFVKEFERRADTAKRNLIRWLRGLAAAVVAALIIGATALVLALVPSDDPSSSERPHTSQTTDTPKRRAVRMRAVGAASDVSGSVVVGDAPDPDDVRLTVRAEVNSSRFLVALSDSPTKPARALTLAGGEATSQTYDLSRRQLRGYASLIIERAAGTRKGQATYRRVLVVPVNDLVPGSFNKRVAMQTARKRRRARLNARRQNVQKVAVRLRKFVRRKAGVDVRPKICPAKFRLPHGATGRISCDIRGVTITYTKFRTPRAARQWFWRAQNRMKTQRAAVGNCDAYPLPGKWTDELDVTRGRYVLRRQGTRPMVLWTYFGHSVAAMSHACSGFLYGA